MFRHWLDQTRHRAAHWAAIKLGAFHGQPPSLAPGGARPRVGTAGRGVKSNPHTKPAPPKTADIRAWINQRAECLAGADAALHSRQWLRGIAYGWMEGHLTDLGFARSTEVAQAGTPPLAADLTDIFYWYLEPARLGWLARRKQAAQRNGEPLRPPSHRDAVWLFESHATRAAARGRELTGALHRWLIHEVG